MDRRDVLKAVVSGVAGVGMMAASSDVGALGKEKRQVSKASRHSKSFIDTNDGVPLFYRDWGAGRPLVFLAPWGLHSDWWEYQMAYLVGQGLRCISFDRRGHGKSAEPKGGYDFDTLADDLNAVIEELDLHDATLIGQSMGCGEVVRFISRHGNRRVARIVMVATITPLILKTADNPDGMDSSYLQKVREALAADRPHVIASAAQAFFGVPKNVVSSEMMDWWTKMLLQCSLKVLLDLQRVFTETDFRSELRTISLPTLIIHGDSDTSTPFDLTGRKTASLIFGSQLRVYENAAHGLPITHAGRLNADLLAFSRT